MKYEIIFFNPHSNYPDEEKKKILEKLEKGWEIISSSGGDTIVFVLEFNDGIH